MNKFLLSLYLICTGVSACAQNQKLARMDEQKGVLIYYMHEPYFFPGLDTSLEKISKSKSMGFKLGNIDLNDIYDSLSHKQTIEIYLSDNGKLDTLTSSLGILKVSIKTKQLKTILSSESNAFGFRYNFQNLLFYYQIRFNIEVLSIKPVLTSDIKAMKSYIKKSILSSENN